MLRYFVTTNPRSGVHFHLCLGDMVTIATAVVAASRDSTSLGPT